MKYAYRILGFLESKSKRIVGVKVLITSAVHFDELDVPACLFDDEVMDYLRFRLAASGHMKIRNLPPVIYHGIKGPLHDYMDLWVLQGQTN